MPEPTYPTLFVNKRESPVTVPEYGRPLVQIPPGREFLVEAYDPTTSYARFKEVVFLEGQRVEVKINPDWNPPDSWKTRYLLELHNIDGSEIEGFYVTGPGEPPIQCYKGIPRLVAITIDSPYIKYKKIEWKLVKERKENAANPNYLVWTTSLKMVREERSKDELAKIEREIKARAKERRG